MTRPKLNKKVLENVVTSCQERRRPLEDLLFAERDREQTRAQMKADRDSDLRDKYPGLEA